MRLSIILLQLSCFLLVVSASSPLSSSFPSLFPSTHHSVDPPPSSYSWFIGASGTCSNRCGGGVALRQVFCQHDLLPGVVVHNSNLCPPPAPSTTVACNTHPCPSSIDPHVDTTVSWYQSTPSSCSVQCGGGVQHVRVMCINGDGAVVNDNSCNHLGLDKPANTLVCNEQACPVAAPVSTPVLPPVSSPVHSTHRPLAEVMLSGSAASRRLLGNSVTWVVQMSTECSVACGAGYVLQYVGCYSGSGSSWSLITTNGVSNFTQCLTSNVPISCLDASGSSINCNTSALNTAYSSTMAPNTLSTVSCTLAACGASFPYNSDGTVFFVQPVASLKTIGPSQFDAVCQSVIANSYAVVCSGSHGGTARNFFSYLQYATGQSTPVWGGFGKPVYAFDYNSRPTQYVQIARNPTDLLVNGINQQSASTFTTFYDYSAITNLAVSDIHGIAASNNAWTGCNVNGTAVMDTCNDWTSNNSSYNGANGQVGGFVPDHVVQNDYLTLLNAGSSSSCGSTNMAVLCSYSPTAFDRILNGDETSVDCGGHTINSDLKTLHSVCAPCPPGTTGPDGTPVFNCTLCPPGTYKPTAGAFQCLPCADQRATSNSGASFCFCAPGFTQRGNAADGSSCLTISVNGDPQITGIQGQDFQVHGVPDDVFNMISTKDLQVNARFIYLSTARCLDKSTPCFTHPGTYIDLIGIKLGGQRIRVVAGSYEQGLTVFVDDVAFTVSSTPLSLNFPLSTLTFSSSRKLTLQTPLFILNLVNSDGFMNQEATLRDSTLMAKGSFPRTVSAASPCPFSDVNIHGILGQTWVNCQYHSSLKFIAGEVNDYHESTNNIFGDDFIFNKFSS